MWLLEQNIFDKLAAIAGRFEPDAETIAQFETRFGDRGGDTGPRGLSISGAVAAIQIGGVLTKKPDIMAYYFGGGNTTYPDITAGINAALADASVTQINLMIDSPGGSIDGLFDTIAALQNAKGKKPIHAIVDGLAASAAYSIAAQADKITAKNYGARVGSIGVVASMYVSPYSVDLTSSEAPKKRPDVRTAEGRAMVIEELDALHALFAESIASGRGVTVERVNADFGRGGMFLADEAKKRNMIDAVAEPRIKSITHARAAAHTENIKMTLDELKAQHPALYASIVKIGADAERDRVTAHLTMGAASGDMATAVTAIKDGSEMTASIQATYLAAGMNRADAAKRAADDVAAAAALAAVGTPGAPVTSSADTVADLVEASLGIKS